MIALLTASGSPSPEPTSKQDVEQATRTFFHDLTSSDWWVTEGLPGAVRIGVIIVLALLLRYVLIKVLTGMVTSTAKAKERKLGKSAVQASRERQIDTKRSIQRAHTLGDLFRHLITITVFTLMVLLVLAQLGFNLAPLIAGAGIIGVALGFGAQSLVADFVNGVFMLLEDQFGVGDVIDVGDAVGTVEEVSLRVTQLRAMDGSLWFVRNGEIMRVSNMSQDWSRTVLDIGVSYDTDVRQARELLARVGEDFDRDDDFGPLVLEVPEVWGVQELGSDSVVIRMVIKTSPGDQWSVARELRERIKVAFDTAGIEIPYPQRSVWLRYPPDSVDPHQTRSPDAAGPDTDPAADLRASDGQASDGQASDGQEGPDRGGEPDAASERATRHSYETSDADGSPDTGDGDSGR